MWYQSRERGMLENDLLLGSFARDHLDTMEDPLLRQYEVLLVQPDWDIFSWVTDKKPVPPQFDNELMMMLRKHIHSNPLKYNPGD